jgi:hypothetical protein
MPDITIFHDSTLQLIIGSTFAGLGLVLLGVVMIFAGSVWMLPVFAGVFIIGITGVWLWARSCD